MKRLNHIRVKKNKFQKILPKIFGVMCVDKNQGLAFVKNIDSKVFRLFFIGFRYLFCYFYYDQMISR